VEVRGSRVSHESMWDVFWLTLWNASVTPPSSLFLSLSQYHSAYSPTGDQEGTEYTPQWMKMPNLASSYHSGSGRVSRLSQVGS
jgi:hypothetical protein